MRPSTRGDGSVDPGDTGATGGDSPSGLDGGPWCVAHGDAAFFCSDFDEQPLASEWNRVDQAAFGSISLDTVTFTSPLRSLRIKLNPNAPPCSYMKVQRKALSPAVGRMRAAFDLFLGDVNSGAAEPSAYVAELRSDVNGAGCVYLLYAGQGIPGILEQVQAYDGGGRSQVHNFAQGAAGGRWRHVSIDVNFLAVPKGTLSVTIDGTSVLDADPIFPECAAKGTPDIELGFHCMGDTQAHEVRFDNVTLDTK